MNSNEFIQTLDWYFERDDIAGAGEYLEKSRADAESSGSRGLLLTVLNEMMGYYRKTGEAEKGLESVYSALALLSELGLDNSDTGGVTLLNAATTLKAFKRQKEAIILYEKAEKVLLSCLSPDDGRIAGLNNNMALTLVDLGRLSEAEERYERALSILKGLFGREADIANTYVNMAELYNALSDYEKLEYCLENAVKILDGVTKRDGYYAYTCRKCAPTLGYFGYFAAEKELNERADKIYEGIKAR